MTATTEATTTVHVVRVTEIVGGYRQQGTWTWPAVLDRDEVDGLRGMSPADVLAEFAWDEGVDVEVAADATSIRWTRDGREYVAETEAVTTAVDGSVITSGSLIEVTVAGHGPRLGIVGNLPPRRVVARVSHLRDGLVVAYDADGGRLVVTPGAVETVVTDRPEAGWANLHRERGRR